MHMKISSAKRWPFCPGGYELNLTFEMQALLHEISSAILKNMRSSKTDSKSLTPTHKKKNYNCVC